MNKIFLFLLIVFVFNLHACSAYDQVNIQNENRSYKKRMDLLEKQILHEEFHYFNSPKLTLHFPYAIDDINLKEVVLLENEQAVSSPIHSERTGIIERHMLSIEIDEQVTYFNRIKILDKSDNEIILHTGEYFINDGIMIGNIPEEQLISVRNGYSKLSEGKFLYRVEFTVQPDSSIAPLLPDTMKKIIEDESFKVIEKKEDTIVYEYSFKIPKSYFSSRDLTDVSFQLRWQQSYNGYRSVILESFVPITLNDL